MYFEGARGAPRGPRARRGDEELRGSTRAVVLPVQQRIWSVLGGFGPKKATGWLQRMNCEPALHPRLNYVNRTHWEVSWEVGNGKQKNLHFDLHFFFVG